MNKRSFLKDIGRMPASFWVLNILQMLEKLAYWSVLLQLPIYIAQKDIPGGLHWDQTDKGMIFFWWALVQNLTPVLAGGYADRTGHKKTLFISFVFIIAGYLIIGFQREYWPFLAGIIILGLGSGIFKPALQGALANSLEGRNTSLGWGIYFMLLNLAVFFGPPLSKYLKQISWEMVFFGSAAVFALNIIVLLFLNNGRANIKTSNYSMIDTLKQIISRFLDPKLFWFVVIMSGFTIIYMQFYETLPNFIYDWTDTSGVVRSLGLPEYMTMQTERGQMISYEWLYNLNAGLIILGVIPLAWIFGHRDRIRILSAGILLSTIGLFTAGGSPAGFMIISGFIIYTIGEMITNPRFAEHLGSIAPAGERSMYLSYMNISLAIGLAGGSISGGWMYHHYGEKAFLASRYLREYLNINETDLTKSLAKLQSVTGLNPSDTADLLWNTYDPFVLWLPFIAVGMLSFAGLILYRRKFGRV